MRLYFGSLPVGKVYKIRLTTMTDSDGGIGLFAIEYRVEGDYPWHVFATWMTEQMDRDFPSVAGRS